MPTQWPAPCSRFGSKCKASIAPIGNSFSGFGFFVTTLLVFSAVLAFELSRLPAQVLRAFSRVRWAFALCYLVIAVLTWGYFFLAPGIFATVAAFCLALAAAVQPREEKP